LAEVEAAKREADDVKELVSGIVRVGALPTIAPYLLPGLMGKFTRQYPGVETVIEEDTTMRLLELALAYEIDFALVSGPIRDGRLQVRELYWEELLLALPPSHRLATKSALRLADLKNEQLIVMKEGHCLGDQVLEFCDQRNLRPRVSFRSAQLETVQALVRSGVGISLVPAMAARAKQKSGLKYRSLAAPSPNRSILAVWPTERPPGRAANEFLKLVCSESDRKE
jgi:LysR family hydrogen peroxide-inducible transcriptional activator